MEYASAPWNLELTVMEVEGLPRPRATMHVVVSGRYAAQMINLSMRSVGLDPPIRVQAGQAFRPELMFDHAADESGMCTIRLVGTALQSTTP